MKTSERLVESHRNYHAALEEVNPRIRAFLDAKGARYEEVDVRLYGFRLEEFNTHHQMLVVATEYYCGGDRDHDWYEMPLAYLDLTPEQIQEAVAVQRGAEEAERKRKADELAAEVRANREAKEWETYLRLKQKYEGEGR